ncbi:MAG: PAS domain-containing protein [Terriglobales bacterium]
MGEKNRVNILMVDDQPAKLLSYEVILSELGENLIKASSGREALEQMLKREIAIVLMDVSMPELDGFELAEMIHQHPRCRETKVIFISAVHLTALDQLRGYERGAVDYISVPVIPELLRAKVSVFAELHRKTHQLEAFNRELEQRVAQRTEELEERAGALQLLNIELARKNQELDAIVKTAPDIIFSRQPDGGRDYISARFYEYTGAAPNSASGVGWLDYVHPQDSEPSWAQWMHCIQSGESYESEYRLRGRDGQYRWFRARAVPIRDQAGKVARWYGTCSDIHDSKLLEHSMRESAVELERIVDERTIALRRLSSRLMTMQDDERRRIARELHDGLGQEMVALKMMLNGISRQAGASLDTQITEADRLINHATQQIRTMSHLLHPPLLDEVGLMSALRWYLDGLTQRSGIGIELEMHPHDFPRLALDLETAIFRIIQEALTNVFRHSGASNVEVSLLKQEGKIEIKIRDDGKGVAEDIVNMRTGSTGVGIGGMNERAKEFGGELQVANAHPGTIVQVIIPIPAEPSAVPAPAEKMTVLRTKVSPGVGLQ